MSRRLSHPAFDLVHIEAQWGSTTDDIYREILRIFAHEGEKLVEDAHRFLAGEDWEGLARTAHTLKGASANIGALGLARCAEAIEAAAISPRTRAIAALLRQADTAWTAVQIEILAGGPGKNG